MRCYNEQGWPPNGHAGILCGIKNPRKPNPVLVRRAPPILIISHGLKHRRRAGKTGTVPRANFANINLSPVLWYQKMLVVVILQNKILVFFLVKGVSNILAECRHRVNIKFD
jgi:hypothetical protein